MDTQLVNSITCGCESKAPFFVIYKRPDANPRRIRYELLSNPTTLENDIASYIFLYILPGSHIISDGWVAYAHIDQIQGGTLIHDANFVNPDNPDYRKYVDARETKTTSTIWNVQGTVSDIPF